MASKRDKNYKQYIVFVILRYFSHAHQTGLVYCKSKNQTQSDQTTYFYVNIITIFFILNVVSAE